MKFLWCVLGLGPLVAVVRHRPNVLPMVRSERKIVNSPTAILFDNRTKN
ncbi:hypothetical protein PCL1606_08790 [Pseudomonas chlororaphis]|uniref:Uncharacterized protein n=1 Tax=Pseudomonas chlororaphis TaxID=587753 RepID=A0A0D5XUG7_9PSED|nr:hypothetical protein PCL1606_08790 [Pseudomonas chlororaphis]